MNGAVSISVTGIDKVDDIIKRMSDSLSHSVVGSAHKEAAKPLIEKAKLLAPEGPNGYLVDSIGPVRVAQAKANSIGEIEVGPRRKAPYKGYHGHLVERGTGQRQTREGANRGIMPKHPFMVPAFEATKGQVENGIKGILKKRILKAAFKGGLIGERFEL